MTDQTDGRVRPQDYQVPVAALKLLPREQAARLRVCPLGLHESSAGVRKLTVACADPTNFMLIDQVQQLAGCRVQPVPATEQDILLGIAVHYRAIMAEAAAEPSAQEPSPPQPAPTAGEVLDEKSISASDLLDRILHQAVSERASDIHLEPYENGIYVRFRVDGMLLDHLTYDRQLHPTVISRIKILADLDIAQTRLPQDGRFDVLHEKQTFDVRTSIVPTLHGESAVLRILPKGTLALSFADLGLDAAGRQALETMIRQPFGMVLFTGPTGSGKTTTLYACLTLLDFAARKIITVEDPVEYQFPRVSQMQVHPRIGLTFAAGLRAILRQDPDVIMVGEIRDLETLEMAMQSALTGHLVLSTLHCNDAAAAAARMVDVGAEPFLVSSSVTGLVAQRLVRRVCPACKTAAHVSADVRRQLGLPAEDVTYYRGAGCAQCRGTGYFGRISVFEVLPMNEAVQEAIVRKAGAGEIRQLIRAQGVPSLRDDGLAKARAGVTSLEEVLRAVYIETA